MFIITSLPRSRTAWIANYLTHGDTFCLHDALKNGLPIVLPERKYVGITDSAAALLQDKLIETFPEAKWVIVERDYNESLHSIKELGVNADLFAIQTKLEELRPKVNPLVIPFESLDQAIGDIAKYVNPEWVHDQARHDMLVRFNVQLSNAHEKAKGFKPEGWNLAQTCVEYMSVVKEMCAPEPFAFEWFEQLVYASLTWDHYMDSDAINKELFDRVMLSLTTEWPLNPFLRKFSASIVPTMVSALSSWRTSYLDGASRDMAYAIYGDVPAAMAFCIGGNKRVDEFMPRIRKLVIAMRQLDDLRDGGKK